jgi:hypothetical protein
MAKVTVPVDIVIDVGDRDPEDEKTIEYAEDRVIDELSRAEDAKRIHSYLIK